jgi:maleylpyruvate isomerase
MLLPLLDDATARLLEAADRLGDDDVRKPSLLPDWTRGHVLTHLADAGDALVNLLTGARTGEPRPAYASREARNAAIEAGAGRPAKALAADVARSAEAFREALAAMPEEAWERPVRILGSAEFPASQVPLRRLVELELHHVDLGLGYTAARWPAAFAELELPEPMHGQRLNRIFSNEASVTPS